MHNPQLVKEQQSAKNELPLMFVETMYDLVIQAVYREDEESVHSKLSNLITSHNFENEPADQLFAL